MIVRCEHCKTEYEFDDAQISEGGVGVKCTACGHVFTVKKSPVLVTTPVHSEPAAVAGLPDASAVFEFSAPKPKEWKVRQANKDILTLKELATLQRWIVEGKVSRQDEISLTGESWKRLGNIVELASFFNVVDEAKRAVELPVAATPPPPERSVPRPPVPAIEQTPVEPAAKTSPLAEFENFSFPRMPQDPQTPPAPNPAQFSKVGHTPQPKGEPAQRMAPVVPGDPAFAQSGRPASALAESDIEGAAGFPRHTRWTAIGPIALLGLALVAYLAYRYFVWIPERQNRARTEAVLSPGLAPRAEQERAPREQAAAEADRAAAAIVANEGEEAQATQQTITGPIADGQSRSSPPKASSVDEIASPKKSLRAPLPPTSTSEDPNFATGEPGPPARSKANMPRNFDSLVSQGDHLRERERPAAALRAYAKAAELEPDRPEPFTGRGLALIDLGRLAEAEKSLQQALRLDPKSSVALMGLAEAYRAEGKKSEAIRYYERYLEVLPNGSEASVARSAIKALRE